MKTQEFHKPVAGVDCYGLLGLKERFFVDPAELERAYLERSKQVHPDRFVNAPASERVASLQASMQLNDAYKTLKKPMARAEYLLGRRGVVIGDSERLDPEILMEILEEREALAEAKHAGDRARLRALEAAMQGRKDAALTRVADLFRELEAGPEASAAVLDAIKLQIILLRYIQRYLDELEDDEL